MTRAVGLGSEIEFYITQSVSARVPSDEGFFTA